LGYASWGELRNPRGVTDGSIVFDVVSLARVECTKL